MKNSESEVAIIDFTKFDIAQLPELKGKKVEIAKLIKANPIVEITDNASYELAKKSRTAVKSLRTSLEKEKKDVNDRIKNSVLVVVANEYDSIIKNVRNHEFARQEKVDDWEEKKEQERMEKLRLEQERVDSIKKSIGEFRSFWEDKLSNLTFETIEDETDLYSVAVVEFDRESLAEFDVLFTDAVNYIDKTFEARIKTLEEQEQIRLDQEKLRIQNAISNWFNSWSDAILKYPTSAICQDNFAIFNQEKGLECGEFQSEFGAKRSQLVECFEARINGLKTLEFTQEEQRIAQEKFLKDKQKFEEKQAEAKYQERVKQLLDLGCVFSEEKNGYEKQGYWIHSDDIKSASDELLERELADAKEVETLINELEVIIQEVEFEEVDGPAIKYVDPRKITSDEFANENYHEEDVNEIAKPKEELTWATIYSQWLGTGGKKDFYDWISENYNCPTPKN